MKPGCRAASIGRDWHPDWFDFTGELALIPAEDRLIGAQGGKFLFVNTAHVDGKIESVPRRLHSAVAEEQPLNFVRGSSLQGFATRNFIPLG